MMFNEVEVVGSELVGVGDLLEARAHPFILATRDEEGFMIAFNLGQPGETPEAVRWIRWMCDNLMSWCLQAVIDCNNYENRPEEAQ